jgi:hypothetical protein
MLAQGTEGHVVNVASIAGFLPYHRRVPGLGEDEDPGFR